LSKHPVAEILVFRQQQPIFVFSAIHDFRVARTRRDDRHVNDILPRTITSCPELRETAAKSASTLSSISQRTPG
jgi:hypothetical protein